MPVRRLNHAVLYVRDVRVPAEHWERETATGPMIGPLDLAAEIARWGDQVTGAAAGSVT